jgi:NAD(P)-dependent dehydrogenase (short-subunit alcohol dehydrogenase family)
MMFAEHGASGLVLSDLDGAALAAAADRARALGPRVETVAGDITKDDSIAALAEAAKRLGRLDVLVNNAGARRAAGSGFGLVLGSWAAALGGVMGLGSLSPGSPTRRHAQAPPPTPPPPLPQASRGTA